MVCSGNNAITFNGYVSGTAPQTSANLNFIYIQNPSQVPTIPKMQLLLMFSMSPIAFTKFPISWFSCFYFILFQVLILRAIDIDLQRLLIISKITILVKAVIETQNEHGRICKYDSSDVALRCGTTSRYIHL